MAKNLSALFVVAVILFAGLLFPAPVSAADGCSEGSSGFLGLPTWHKYLEKDGDCSVQSVKYDDGSVHIGLTIGAVLLAITEILLRIAGIVAVGAVIYGGISYTTSQGSPDKTAAAKNIIMNGLIGMVIAALAVVIVGLVSGVVTGSGGSSSTNPQQQSHNKGLIS